MEQRLLECVPTALASQFHGLPAAVRQVLRLCDGTRTLGGVCALSPLSTGRTKAVVARLLHRGLVVQRTGKSPRGRHLTEAASAWLAGVAEPAIDPVAVVEPVIDPVAVVEPVIDPAAVLEPMSGCAAVVEAVSFSDEEEQFFSSSIDHLLSDEG